MQKLEEIKRIRKRLGLSQKDLALSSGVSQSLIAKIESNKVIPTYNKATQLFQTLEKLQEKDEPKVKDVMTKKIVTVKSNEKIVKIIKLMKANGISQIPVLQQDSVCGVITESGIIDKTLELKGKIVNLTAGDIMEEAPPMVPTNFNLKSVLQLLKYSQIVLITEKGKLKGIVSKSDVLGQVNFS
jgi:predicted transcriptional regulator